MFLTKGTLRRFFRRLFFFVISAAMCFTAFAPLPRTAPAVRNRDTGDFFLPDYGSPLVAAHRMGKSNAPENTLMAVKNSISISRPADILETDLEYTADGELVLFHDLYLDEKTDAAEFFGRRHVTVFSKTYAELRCLNMGEYFTVDGETPYAGLRGNDIPDDLRMVRAEDMFDYVETTAPGRFRYILEIKYPFPWGHKMVDKLFKILTERQMTDRVIVASYWADVTDYIDRRYAGKLMRSANPFEVMDFYGCFIRNVDLSKEEIPFMALQMPYYWKNDKLLVANLGKTALIDYAHRYGLSVQYYTVSRNEDVQDLFRGGADVIMADRPQKAFSAIRETQFYSESETKEKGDFS